MHLRAHRRTRRASLTRVGCVQLTVVRYTHTCASNESWHIDLRHADSFRNWLSRRRFGRRRSSRARRSTWNRGRGRKTLCGTSRAQPSVFLREWVKSKEGKRHEDSTSEWACTKRSMRRRPMDTRKKSGSTYKKTKQGRFSRKWSVHTTQCNSYKCASFHLALFVAFEHLKPFFVAPLFELRIPLHQPGKQLSVGVYIVWRHNLQNRNKKRWMWFNLYTDKQRNNYRRKNDIQENI